MQVMNTAAGSGENAGNSLELYALRRNRLRVLMARRRLDALLVASAPNRFYLSGFELHDPQPGESAGMLLITADGEDWLATDARYELAAKSLWDERRVLIYGGDSAGALARLIASQSLLAGIESKGVSWNFARKLLAALPAGHAILPGDGLVEKLRMIKDESEKQALRASFALNHKMFEWLEREIVNVPQREISEAELAREIEAFFRNNGAQELAFATIAAAGKSGALPHAIPLLKKFASGVPLLVDAGCRVDNYCSDQTRSWWRGEHPAPEFEKALILVREAQQAAFETMRPGVPCREVYRAARRVFEQAGVEKAFNHGLGHGVGLETHEEPRLSAASAQTLAEGMTVTVEPGLYYPEWGGVRWENTVLVTADGIEIL